MKPNKIRDFTSIPAGNSFPANGKYERLLTAAIFKGIEPKNVRTILEAGRFEQVRAKHIFMREGEKAERLFLLRTGQAKFYKLTKAGDEILLQWLAPLHVFGIGTFLESPLPYVGTAEALCDCEAYVWNRSSVRGLTLVHPRLSANALEIILRYVNNYILKHIHLASSSAAERLAGALTSLATHTGHPNPNGIELSVTNEQLSRLANISPFTTSRLLNRWQREGTISKKRLKVVVNVPEALITS